MVVGISCDPIDDNKAFRDKFAFPYDLLSDTDMSMSNAYGAGGGARASRVSVLLAPDGTVACSYATVKPAEHADEVLADLKRLG